MRHENVFKNLIYSANVQHIRAGKDRRWNLIKCLFNFSVVLNTIPERKLVQNERVKVFFPGNHLDSSQSLKPKLAFSSKPRAVPVYTRDTP